MGTGKIVDVPDLSLYMGKWYEIQKFYNFFERGLQCNYAEYTLESDASGPYVNVNNTGYDGTAYSSQIGKAVQPTPPLGAFIVSFGVNPFVPSALIYNCSEVLGFGVVEYSWILSRQSALSPSVVSSLTGNLTALGVDISQFAVTDQVHCP